MRPDTSSRRAELRPAVTQQTIDQTSTEAWQRALADHTPDVIILLAGSVRGRDYNDFTAANVAPVQALTKALQQHAESTFPPAPEFASTSTAPSGTALGHAKTIAPRVLLISSLAASQPQLSHYAASKRAGETALQDAELTNTDWSILRPPAIYGPGDTELAGLFQTIRRGLMPRPGPADQRVNFLHVQDLCSAIAAWIATPNLPYGATYTIDDGTESGYSWPQIGAILRPQKPPVTLPVPAKLLRFAGHINLLLARAFNYQPMLSPGKAQELGYPRWLCDNHAFSAATGWSPTIGLADGSTCYFDS